MAQRIRIPKANLKSVLEALSEVIDKCPIVGEKEDEPDIVYIILGIGSPEIERRVITIAQANGGDYRYL